MKKRRMKTENETCNCRKTVGGDGSGFRDRSQKPRDGFVEGNGYLVSWCVGHLVGLCDAADYDDRYRKWNYDDLPIVPEKWKKKILEGTKKQFGILQTLMNRNDVTEVICGTDAGREGELIFRLVYEQAGCRKPVNVYGFLQWKKKQFGKDFKI